MKKLVCVILFLCSASLLFAQNIKPKLEKKGNVIDKTKLINLKCIYVTLLQEDKNGTICH